MVLGICRAPAGKCDLKQIDPHTSRIRPGLWTVSEGWRVARSALGGRWCTRACPRHARAGVSGTRLRALRAQMFPAFKASARASKPALGTGQAGACDAISCLCEHHSLALK